MGASPLIRAVVAASLLVPFALRLSAASADTVGSDRAHVASLLAQLNADNVRASQLSESYDQARLRLQQVGTSLAGAKARIGQTDAQLGAAQQRVKAMAIASYMDGGAARQLSLLIPGSANQIAVRGTYVQAATRTDNNAIDALRAAHIELGHQQASLATAQAQAAAAVSQLAAAQKAAASAAAATEAAYARAQAQLGQAQLLAAQASQTAANQARIQAELTAGRALTPGRASHGVGYTPRAGTSGGSSDFGNGSGASLPPPSNAAQAAIYYATQELGKPYVYGGSGPSSFDCSGLTAWAWGHAGHGLPHSSEQQYYDTTFVSVSQLQPGDLVFYGSPPHHVGIYVGGGRMIDALHTGTNVEYDSIYLEGDLIGGGRVY
jgi:peptidoglycan DL-endopeptidase CwlO